MWEYLKEWKDVCSEHWVLSIVLVLACVLMVLSWFVSWEIIKL